MIWFFSLLLIFSDQPVIAALLIMFYLVVKS